MAAIKKVFASETTIFTSATISTAAATITYSSAIDLVTNGYEGSQVVADITWNSSGASQMEIGFYGSIDSTNWDDTPVFSQAVSVSTGSTEQLSFLVKDLAYVRVGLNVSTNDDNAPSVQVRERSWNWESS